MWVQPSVKCQTGSFQGTLVGRTKWKPSFMWGERERTFGLYFAVCGWLRVPLKCHPKQSCNTPTRNRSCSLYFSRVIIYVPAMNFHSSSPCTKTSHISPKTRWNKAEKPQKAADSWESLSFLSYEFTICFAKLYLNLKAEVCLWEALWE